MTPRPLSKSEVRIGDRVNWRRSIHADAPHIEGVVREITCAGDWLLVDGWDVPLNLLGHVLTLISRPLQPVPTDNGTVIREKTTGMVYVRQGGCWYYGDDNTGWGHRDLFRDDFDVLVPEQVDQ